MRIAPAIIAALTFCVAGCDKPAASPVTNSDAELRATKERIARFEQQMGQQRTDEPKPADLTNGPTDQQILQVAQQLAQQTVGLTSNRISAGPIGVTAGPGQPIGPLVKAVEVSDINRSVQGAECLVVAKVNCEWLPALQQAGQVQGGFQAWFKTYGSQQIAIQDEWLLDQRTRPGIYLTGVKLVFRRFDTGWQFQGLNAF